MKLSEMREWLSLEEVRLTKSLGQNFLHDGNQLRKIVQSAELSQADKVLEIGPGLGPLTELLVEKAGEVLAIEKDRRFVEFLQDRFKGSSKINILQADALQHLRKERRDWKQWKLVSNLPYSVASPILVELAQAPTRPRRMVATLQTEVVHRIVAEAKTEHYGILSLLLQLRYEPQGYLRIPPDCFFPAPEVDSACVTLVRRDQPLLPLDQEELFVRIVKLSFSQRRKMMSKLLRPAWPPELLAAAFEQTGISLQERAEKVRLEQFVKLTQCLAPSQ